MTPAPSPFRQRLSRDPMLQAGVVLVTLVAVAGLAAPWIAPHDPIRGDIQGAYLLAPSGTYPFGTDTQGRDILSRVVWGARISLGVGLISQSVATLLGVTLGLVAGYYGRWVDAVVMRFADITLAFPTLLLLIAVAAAVRPSLPVVFMLIGVVGWAGMARLVRSQVLVLRNADYVQAARALGARDRHILFRHLLPNVRGPVIVAATLGIAGAMMAEAALSFVGLGAQPPTPSWGAMVADGRDLLRVAPWVSVAPGLAIGLAVLGFNLVGDALRELYDPRLRTERA
ncbi:MAG TPA: ABC transporter permease [Gemmatimonadales bacterium]|nr:ABC transporter permease [Gemmatimonadales bacterium]